MIYVIVIFGILILVNFVIGMHNTKGMTSEKMMNGGRKMGLLVIVFSTFATSIGAGDIYSYPALGYEQGWSSLHFILAMPIVVIIMAFTVGKRYYEMGANTISDMLCKVYGEHIALRVISSICMTMGLVAWTAGQYSAFGKSLNMLTGLPATIGTLLGAIIFVIYTVAGGLSSVMAVSIVQGSIMIVGIVLIFFATANAGGGVGAIQSLLPMEFHSFWGGGALAVVTYWINKGLSRFTNFTYWQRLSSAKDYNTGRWGVSLGMLVTGILGTILAIIGMNAFVIMPNMQDPEMIYVNSTVMYFPKWAAGILLGALWAAILSSAGGFLNSAATLVGNDIWFRALKHENSNDKGKVKSIRRITAIIGIGTFFIAWLTPGVLDLMFWAGVWLTPPLIPVLFAAFFDRNGKRVSYRWIVLSLIISATVGFVFEIVPTLKELTSGGTIPSFVTSLIVVLIGMMASIVGKRKESKNA